jgi:RNA polymerase sigma-70 factor (ECF subfamily)
MTPHEYLLRALARWPDLGVEHTFLARLNTGVLETEVLDPVVPEDLYLACAALKGVPAAVREVQSLVKAQFAALGHFRLAPAVIDDVRGLFMARLLVTPARLERYSGRGPLEAWLRVAATRDVLSWLRQNQRDVVADDEALVGAMEPPVEGPELTHLKERYHGAFSAAFRRAIQGLETRQRNLLRQYYLDELSLDELGAVYRVHRATIARWLADARVALLERTRDEISSSLGLNRLEVDSLMRLVQSRLDLSAGIFLSAQSESSPKGK